eukprot:TRINITY_DN33927_c0_g1_i1.p1 TRINITY_DN33927_c0_g1~~TRINITY_DN33927_c0_g1_i1.p1  ORF type:complete len:442 (+),score=51.78 TRINITY_DN33927_c0_g1_i1:71-1327(+)
MIATAEDRMLGNLAKQHNDFDDLDEYVYAQGLEVGGAQTRASLDSAPTTLRRCGGAWDWPLTLAETRERVLELDGFLLASFAAMEAKEAPCKQGFNHSDATGCGTSDFSSCDDGSFPTEEKASVTGVENEEDLTMEAALGAVREATMAAARVSMRQGVQRAEKLRTGLLRLVTKPLPQLPTMTTGCSGTVGKVCEAVGSAMGAVNSVEARVDASPPIRLAQSIPIGTAVVGDSGPCVVVNGPVIVSPRPCIVNTYYIVSPRTCIDGIGGEEFSMANIGTWTGNRDSMTVSNEAGLPVWLTTKVRDIGAASKSSFTVLKSDPGFRVAAVSASAGGSAGGLVGGVTGALVGATSGIVPALFTFGLSIPIFAVGGFCTGALAGSAVGTVSGGAVGYGGYTLRNKFREAPVGRSTIVQALQN